MNLNEIINRKNVQTAASVTIVLSYLFVELHYGIDEPSLELRLILLTALVSLFPIGVTKALKVLRGRRRRPPEE